MHCVIIAAGKGGITLAVDTNMLNPLVDIDDVTKVMIEENKIIDINKKLTSYNGFDTGLFHCSSAIFEAIENSISENHDTSLSGGVRWLARLEKVRPFLIKVDAFIIQYGNFHCAKTVCTLSNINQKNFDTITLNRYNYKQIYRIFLWKSRK